MRKMFRTLAFALLPAAAEAQTHVEVRGSLTVGSYSSSRAGLEIEPRVSFDVVLRRNLTDRLSVYGSYSRMEFGCVEQFCRGRPKVVSGNHGAVGGEVSWHYLWARVGGMVGVAKIDGARNPAVGFGGQVAIGGRYEVMGFQLRPGLSLERVQAKYSAETDWATAISLDFGGGYSLPFP